MTQYEIFKAHHPRIVSGFLFMQKVVKIIPPVMPNFFSYEMPAGKKEDGVKLNTSIPISELTEEEANEFADMMRTEFIKHWKNKKGI